MMEHRGKTDKKIKAMPAGCGHRAESKKKKTEAHPS